MNKRDYVIPMPAVDLKQALTDIIDSIAAGNKALSRILEAESKLLERVKNEACDISSFDNINSSINSIVKSVTIIQLINKYELEEAENTLKNIVYSDEYDELEE
jgi:hypothetical protein